MAAQVEVMDEIETIEGSKELVTFDGSLAVEMNRVEIDQSIATARRYPRVISRISKNILSLVTLDEDTAEECMYALPRSGKPIKGPSARFAEVVKAQYGNCRVASRVIAVDRIEKVVIAEGIFHDLETNVATRSETRRRITTSNGKIYNDDMIIMTGNAACAIALRNATLGGVPRPLWRGAYEAVQKLIAGDITTLAVKREAGVKAFARFGATPEQVFTALGLQGLEDVQLEHITVLRGMLAALKNGESTFEEMFSKPGGAAEQVNTGLSERLRAANADGAAKEGFTSTRTEAQTDVTAQLDQALAGDKIPSGDAPADDGFPGDRQPESPAADPPTESRPSTGPTLTQRIASFKRMIDGAETVVKAQQLRADAKPLWIDVDKGDADETGTSADLEAYVNARCAAIEAADGNDGAQP